MRQSFFVQVKEAIRQDAERILTELGVKLKHGLRGEWSQGCCMVCQETSGSASYSQEGFLKCHQCGRKVDIFQWLAETTGATTWDVCKDLAQRLNVELAIKKPRGSKPPSSMTWDVLRASVHNLWEQDQAASCRKFLHNRNLADPKLLEEFGVGFLSGYLTFAQFTTKGALRPRFRRYVPGGQVKWTWSPGKGETQGFWPYAELPKDGSIWLCEGEWDVLVAWFLLRLQDQGIYAFTWTGGAGAPIPKHRIPEEWRGRRVDICYDNDCFQGPEWPKHLAPDEKARLAMELRRKNLINGVAAAFVANKCEVFLRAVPILPLENFGADLRDWVEEGGRNLDDIPAYPFADVKLTRDPPIECGFLDVYTHGDRDVTFQASVGSIDADGVTIPQISRLNCAMNTRSQCGNCLAPTRFPDQLIPWEDYPRELANGLAARNMERYVLQHIVGKPSGCPQAEVIPVKYLVGAEWTAVHDEDEETNQRDLLVIGDQRPALSGDVEVTGRVYHSGKTVMVMAEKLFQVDKAEIDLGGYVNDLLQLCPSKTDDAAVVAEYLHRRATDHAFNVTRIHGRPDLHIAHDLLAHSAISLNIDGQESRGWLDIAIIGDTRTGKSVTFRKMMEHHQLGKMHACMENISRAGLTMGASREDGRGTRLKPGLFPRCHRKMLVLDEFHYMVEATRDDVMAHLQSARDNGRVHGVKIYGDRSLPARVRLANIGNWSRGDKNVYRFPCEHFLHLYGKPEAVSRLDFGMTVTEDPTDDSLVEVEQEWSRDLTRALILRAWAMDAQHVRVTPEAMRLAVQQCQDWRECYAHGDLPLFTPEEKVYSLLRIAVSAANLCFSHPAGEPEACEVRPCHVEWAAAWLTRVWHESGYDNYSRVEIGKQEVAKPFESELMLTVKLSLKDSVDASVVLDNFIGRFTMPEMAAILGFDPHDAAKWISKMIRNNVFRKIRAANAWNVEYAPTKGGTLMIRNLLALSEDYPHLWRARYDRIEQWTLNGGHSDPDLLPLTLSTRQLRGEWDEEPDGAENLLQGPGA